MPIHRHFIPCFFIVALPLTSVIQKIFSIQWILIECFSGSFTSWIKIGEKHTCGKKICFVIFKWVALSEIKLYRYMQLNELRACEGCFSLIMFSSLIECSKRYEHLKCKKKWKKMAIKWEIKFKLFALVLPWTQSIEIIMWILYADKIF